MKFQPQLWIEEEQLVRGVLQGASWLIADGNWIACDPQDRPLVVESTKRLARWLDARQPRRLPTPYGIVYDPAAIVLLSSRTDGAPLVELKQVPAAMSLAAVSVLLYVVDTWLDGSDGIPLSATSLTGASVHLDHTGELMVRRLIPSRDQSTRQDLMASLAELLATLLTKASEDDAHRTLATQIRDSLHDPESGMGPAEITRRIHQEGIHAGQLSEFAQEVLVQLGPRGGRTHPSCQQSWRVEHWDLFTADDITYREPREDIVEARYAIQRTIAMGGMGRIHQAWDPSLQREVALKVLYEDGLQDAPFVSRFLREIRITAQLNHPAIIPVHHLETTASGAPAFTMKHVEGMTFRDYLRECIQQRRAGALAASHTLNRRLDRFITACDAVAYAHSRGVLHRDLKLENMMVGRFYEVYVMDWGVAKRLQHDRTDFTIDDVAEVTQSGDIVGTETYMSPEQALGHHDLLTPASDQFSLGLVLFEIVALLHARATGTPDEMLEEARAGWDDEMVDIDGDPIPTPLVAIIRKATRFHPEDRYESVEAFADDIRHYLADEEIKASPDGFVMRTWRRMSHRPTRTLGLLVMLVSLASVLATLGLARALEAQRRANAQIATVANLIAVVHRTTRHLDSELQRQTALLESMVSHLEALHGEGLASDDLASSLLLGRIADESSADFPTERARWQSPTLMSDELRALNPRSAVHRAITETMVRSRQSNAAYWEPDTQREILAAPTRLVSYVRVGWADGTGVSLPGDTSPSSEWSATTQPWYITAAAHGATTWSTPYSHMSSDPLLLAVAAPMRGQDGTLLGVGALELSLTHVVDMMGSIPSEHLENTYLVDESGRVIVDGRGESFTPTQEPRLFDTLLLVEALRADRSRGMIREDEHLILYDHMGVLPWTFVARFSKQALQVP